MAETFVVVDAFEFYVRAAAAKALLEERGIPTVLTDVETTNTNWFWVGWMGGIKLAVPESKAPEAKEFLAALRKADQTVSSAGAAVPLKATCLACGAALTEESRDCPKCGWSFSGEDVIQYENGPLPEFLVVHAYAPVEARRFALPVDWIPPYLDWCGRNGLSITGWETWRRSLLSPTVMERVEGKGAVDLLNELSKMSHARTEGVLVCVLTAAAAPTRNDDELGAHG